MDSKSDYQITGKAAGIEENAEEPKSVRIASRGIRTDQDAAEYLSALIGDVMSRKVSSREASTGINAMGKLLKVVEMRHKYGNPEDQNRKLQLITDPKELEERKLWEEEEKILAAATVIQKKRAEVVTLNARSEAVKHGPELEK